MHNFGFGSRKFRRLTRILAPAILFWTFGSLSRAWAQGMHDWGMWFGTLLVVGAVATLVLFLDHLVSLAQALIVRFGVAQTVNLGRNRHD